MLMKFRRSCLAFLILFLLGFPLRTLAATPGQKKKTWPPPIPTIDEMCSSYIGSDKGVIGYVHGIYPVCKDIGAAKEALDFVFLGDTVALHKLIRLQGCVYLIPRSKVELKETFNIWGRPALYQVRPFGQLNTYWVATDEVTLSRNPKRK